jgi:hypothetical protein
MYGFFPDESGVEGPARGREAAAQLAERVQKLVGDKLVPGD